MIALVPTHQTLLQTAKISAFALLGAHLLHAAKNHFFPVYENDYDCMKVEALKKIEQVATCALKTPIASLPQISLADILHNSCLTPREIGELYQSCKDQPNPLSEQVSKTLYTVEVLAGVASLASIFTLAIQKYQSAQ